MAPKAKTPKPKNDEKKPEETEKVCFIVMPISDQDGYPAGHFTRVYNHIIKPACLRAGYTPRRADENESTNVIILDILKEILTADLVICDLSARNPNVMYELGIRQAFDKPVVLLKDQKTPRSFDIQGLRSVEYQSSLRVDFIEDTIAGVVGAIHGTVGKEAGINSLVSLLGVTAATAPEQTEISRGSLMLLQEFADLKRQLSLSGPRNSTLRGARPLDEASPDTEVTFVRQRDSKRFTFRLNDRILVNGEEIGKVVRLTASIVTLHRPDGLYESFVGTHLVDRDLAIFTPVKTLSSLSPT